MVIYEDILNKSEYKITNKNKKTIVIKHSSGNHNPENYINKLKLDRSKGGGEISVAPHYVIGNVSFKGDDKYDGKIHNILPINSFSNSIDCKKNGETINEHSVVIVLCSYSFLSKNSKNEYYNSVNDLVDNGLVCDLGKNFRRHRYWYEYSDRQIDSLNKLLLYLSNSLDIDLKKGIYQYLEEDNDIEDLPVLEIQKILNYKGILGINDKPLEVNGIMDGNTRYAIRTYKDSVKGFKNSFDYNDIAINSGEGLWVTSNFKRDTLDIYPNPKIIEMIKNF